MDLIPIATPLHRVDRYIVARMLSVEKGVPRIGARLLDADGRQVAIVTDVFGPVSKPYLSLRGRWVDKYYVRPRDLLKNVGR